MSVKIRLTEINGRLSSKKNASSRILGHQQLKDGQAAFVTEIILQLLAKCGTPRRIQLELGTEIKTKALPTVPSEPIPLYAS
jgi:hypothetical protein